MGAVYFAVPVSVLRARDDSEGKDEERIKMKYVLAEIVDMRGFFKKVLKLCFSYRYEAIAV